METPGILIWVLIFLIVLLWLAESYLPGGAFGAAASTLMITAPLICRIYYKNLTCWFVSGEILFILFIILLWKKKRRKTGL